MFWCRIRRDTEADAKLVPLPTHSYQYSWHITPLSTPNNKMGNGRCKLLIKFCLIVANKGFHLTPAFTVLKRPSDPVMIKTSCFPLWEHRCGVWGRCQCRHGLRTRMWTYRTKNIINHEDVVCFYCQHKQNCWANSWVAGDLRYTFMRRYGNEKSIENGIHNQHLSISMQKYGRLYRYLHQLCDLKNDIDLKMTFDIFCTQEQRTYLYNVNFFKTLMGIF